MLVPLEPNWTRILAALPENGMGYQVVDILLRDGRRVAGLFVYNAEQLEWPDDRPRIRPTEIAEIVLAQARSDS